MRIRPALLSHPGDCPSQAISHPLGVRPERQDRRRGRRAAREVFKARYVYKKTPSLIHWLFSLKFVQDCNKGKRLCQGVHDTVISHRLLLLLDYLMHKSESPCALIYCQLREESVRTNSCIFLQHCEEIHKASRQDLEGVTLLSMLP